MGAALEKALEAERTQLPLWLPFMLGAGIAAWFVFPIREMWWAAIAGGVALAGGGVAIGRNTRLGLVLMVAGLAFSAGCGLAWACSLWVAAPALSRPMVAEVKGEVVRVERQNARGIWRLTVATDAQSGLPPRVRVSVPLDALAAEPATGARLLVRARLMPPSPPAVPGGYDFRRHAWFQGLGGVGKALGPAVVTPAVQAVSLRQRLTAHVMARLPSGEGGVAAALLTGDQGGISDADQQAMRASGLAHLLSVSGLHISAVVAATFFLTLRLLALSQRLALRWPLLTIAAGAAALAGVGYTLLAGAEVPTIRSCVAAILVLIGMVLGRDAMTLRLVAVGALIVLLIWPEALIGPSFQLSFAAITAIVALHESPRIQRLFAPRPEALRAHIARSLCALLLTGLVVEIALAPIALFHFHKSGVFGALANLVAIPLTTFIIMPAEALALILDGLGWGLGAPFWWITARAIGLLLWLAQEVAALPGASALLPSVPRGAYLLMVCGGLWTMLWRTGLRFAGCVPLCAGALWAVLLPVPDLLITDDGRHLALRDDAGQLAILRPRSGDFVRQTLAERAAHEGELADLDEAARADCSADACIVRLVRGGRNWQILALRSRHMIDWKALVGACADADIIVSARLLPKACHARWLTIDPRLLRQTGGLAITLAPLRVETVYAARDDHPWMAAAAAQNGFQYRRNSPANRP